jgi:tetratricopeptide (TPR) repeat protein
MTERIEKIQSMLLQQPNDLFLNHALALEWIKLGNLENALIAFEKNRNQDANYVATYYHLGKLYESLGSNDKAIETYEQGMKIARLVSDQHAYSELQGAYENLSDEY